MNQERVLLAVKERDLRLERDKQDMTEADRELTRLVRRQQSSIPPPPPVCSSFCFLILICILCVLITVSCRGNIIAWCVTACKHFVVSVQCRGKVLGWSPSTRFFKETSKLQFINLFKVTISLYKTFLYKSNLIRFLCLIQLNKRKRKQTIKFKCYLFNKSLCWDKKKINFLAYLWYVYYLV